MQSDCITEKPCHDDNEAFGRLIGTAATTAAGLFAKVDYLREIARHQAWLLDEREGTALELIESFAGPIRTIWGRSSSFPQPRLRAPPDARNLVCRAPTCW